MSRYEQILKIAQDRKLKAFLEVVERRWSIEDEMRRLREFDAEQEATRHRIALLNRNRKEA